MPNRPMPNRMTDRLRTLAAVLALIGVAALPFDAAAQKAKDTFRFGFTTPLDLLDPYYSGLREITMISGDLVFDKLVYKDPKTFEYKGLLASSWKWIDTTTLEMELRRGVTWHDGRPFTADDVKYTFDYITDKASKVYNPEWNSWIKSTEKLDDHKVRIVTNGPTGPAIEYLAEVLPILPKGHYVQPGKAAAVAGAKIVGTGPYRVANFEAGRQVVYERNESYFADSPKGKPAIKILVFRNLPDQATQIAELLAGGIDWMWRVPPDVLPRLASNAKLRAGAGGSMRTYWVRFDLHGANAHPAFKDKRVRQAVAHALDRKTMAAAIAGPSSPVLNLMCVPGQIGCPNQDSVQLPAFDPKKAKELLAAAGHANGFKVPFWIYSRAVHNQIAEATQGYLRAVGIETALNVIQSVPFYERIEKGEFPLTMESNGWYNINDVEILYPLFFAGGERDLAKDPQIVAWMQEAGKTADAAKRRQLLESIAKRMTEEVLVIPLFTDVLNYAWSSDVDFAPPQEENPRLFLVRWSN